jgi:hypothetical protein
MIPERSNSARYLPTEAEISAECHQIRRTWSPREWKSRWVGDSEGRKVCMPSFPMLSVEPTCNQLAH